MIDKKTNCLDKLNIKLENFNPVKIAKMGYSKVLQDKMVVSSIKNLDINKDIVVSMIDGQVSCKIKSRW